MPTYDYACKTCGKQFEFFQSIKADALTECPESVCEQEDPQLKGHGQVARQISKGAGFILTGEGFYETDYVRKKPAESSGEKKSTETKTNDSQDSGGGAGGKSDSGSSTPAKSTSKD